MPDGSTLSGSIYSARPTVRIADQQYDRLDANLHSMRMSEAVGGLCTLELSFSDYPSTADGQFGFGFGDETILKLGGDIKLYSGPTDGPNEIFRGQISAIECEAGPDTPFLFTVIADDALQLLRKTRRSAVYTDKTPADVVRAVARQYSFTPSIRDGLDAPTSTWVQMNESDLAFLRRVLEPFDADLQIVGDQLQVAPRARDDRGTSGPLTLNYRSNLIRFRATVDLAEQTTEVRVSGWNPAEGSAVSGVANSAPLGPGSGRTGSTVLSSALAISRREHVGHRAPLTQQEASALATALFAERGRRFVRITGTAQGEPGLRVGTFVAFSGVNPLVTTTGTVVEAHHSFDLTHGYVTEFVAESAYMGAAA